MIRTLAAAQAGARQGVLDTSGEGFQAGGCGRAVAHQAEHRRTGRVHRGGWRQRPSSGSPRALMQRRSITSVNSYPWGRTAPSSLKATRPSGPCRRSRSRHGGRRGCDGRGHRCGQAARPAAGRVRPPGDGLLGGGHQSHRGRVALPRRSRGAAGRRRRPTALCVSAFETTLGQPSSTSGTLYRLRVEPAMTSRPVRTLCSSRVIGEINVANSGQRTTHALLKRQVCDGQPPARARQTAYGQPSCPGRRELHRGQFRRQHQVAQIALHAEHLVQQRQRMPACRTGQPRDFTCRGPLADVFRQAGLHEADGGNPGSGRRSLPAPCNLPRQPTTIKARWHTSPPCG